MQDSRLLVNLTCLEKSWRIYCGLFKILPIPNLVMLNISCESELKRCSRCWVIMSSVSLMLWDKCGCYRISREWWGCYRITTSSFLLTPWTQSCMFTHLDHNLSTWTIILASRRQVKICVLIWYLSWFGLNRFVR